MQLEDFYRCDYCNLEIHLKEEEKTKESCKPVDRQDLNKCAICSTMAPSVPEHGEPEGNMCEICDNHVCDHCVDWEYTRAMNMDVICEVCASVGKNKGFKNGKKFEKWADENYSDAIYDEFYRELKGIAK